MLVPILLREADKRNLKLYRCNVNVRSHDRNPKLARVNLDTVATSEERAHKVAIIRLTLADVLPDWRV